MPQAETAVEAAIYKLGGTLFAKLINPLIILFVVFAIALFLYVVFRTITRKLGIFGSGTVTYTNLLWPILGLTIMLSAIGITYFIGNTGNEIFQGQTGAGAIKGIREVTQPIQIR
jgi:uncharacterized membrane protein